MEVEITSYIEDTDIIQSVSEYQQSKVLEIYLKNALKSNNRDLSAILMILT